MAEIELCSSAQLAMFAKVGYCICVYVCVCVYMWLNMPAVICIQHSIQPSWHVKPPPVTTHISSLNWKSNVTRNCVFTHFFSRWKSCGSVAEMSEALVGNIVERVTYNIKSFEISHIKDWIELFILYWKSRCIILMVQDHMTVRKR